MLVNKNSETTVQLVGTKSGETYAVGTSFSASGFSGFGPGATFVPGHSTAMAGSAPPTISDSATSPVDGHVVPR